MPLPTRNPVANKAAQLVEARTDPAAKQAEKEREATIKDAAVEPRRPLGARTNLDSGGQLTSRDTPIRIKATASGHPSTTTTPDYRNPSPRPFKFGDINTDGIKTVLGDIVRSGNPAGYLSKAATNVAQFGIAKAFGVNLAPQPKPLVPVEATKKEYILVDGITGRSQQRQVGNLEILGNRADTLWNALLTRFMSVAPDETSALMGGGSSVPAGLVSGVSRLTSYLGDVHAAATHYTGAESISMPGVLNIPGPIKAALSIPTIRSAVTSVVAGRNAIASTLSSGAEYTPLTMDEYYEQHPEQMMTLRTDTWTSVRPEDAPELDEQFKTMGIPHKVVSVTPLDAAKVAVLGNLFESSTAVRGMLSGDFSEYEQVTGVPYPIPASPMDIVREQHEARGEKLPSTGWGGAANLQVFHPELGHQLKDEVEQVRSRLTLQAKSVEQMAMEATAKNDIRAAEDYWIEYYKLMSQTYRHDGEQFLPTWERGANPVEIGTSLIRANLDVVDNPFYAYSMVQNPTLYTAFLRNLAQVSMQLGRPLDPINNKDDRDLVLVLRADNTNWGDEAIAAVLYDPLTDIAIGKGMGVGKWAVGTAAEASWNILPKTARLSLTNSLFSRATGSVAKMLGTNVDEIGMAAYHYNPFTWGKFVDITVDDVTFIENGVRKVDASRLGSAGGSAADGLEYLNILTAGLKGQKQAAEALPAKIRGFKAGEAMRRLHEIVPEAGVAMSPHRRGLASRLSPKAGAYRKFVEDAGRDVFERSFNKRYDKLIGKGIGEEEAARQAVEYALSYSNDFKNVIPAMKQTVEHAYTEFHTPSKVLGVTDDSALWHLVGGIRKSHALLGGVVGAFSKIRGVWASAVLSFRPAWIARNMIDTYFRVMVETGGGINIFTNLAQSYSRMAPFLEELPPMPSSISRTMASSVGVDQLVLPVYERLLKNPKRYKFPFIFQFWSDASEFQRGGTRAAERWAAETGKPIGKASKAANKFLGGLSIFSTTMRDMNSLVELSARVTTLEHHVTKVWKPLNASAWTGVEAGFRAFGATEDTIQLAKQLWEGSGYSISRLVAYLDTVSRQELKAGQTVSHSLFMTPQIEQSLHGLSPMDQIFFKEILIDRSNRYFVDILNSGRVPDEVDVKLFVQNIRDQVKQAYVEQGARNAAKRATDGSKAIDFDTSEATKPASQAASTKGEPVVSKVDVEGDEAKLEFSEEAADAPVKPDQTFGHPDPISDPTKPNIAYGDDAVSAASDKSYKVDPINAQVEQGLAEDAVEEGVPKGPTEKPGMDRAYERYRQADRDLQRSHAELSRRGAEMGKEPDSILLREEFYTSDMRVRQFLLRKYPGPLDAPVGARRGRWGRYFTLSNIVREQEAKAFDRQASEFLRTGKYTPRKGAQVLDDMGATFKLDEAGSPTEVVFRSADGREVFSIRTEAEVDDFMREFFGPGYAQYDTQTLLNENYTRLNYHDEMYKTSNIGAVKEQAGGPSFYAQGLTDEAEQLTTVADELARYPDQHLVAINTADELVPRGTPYEVVDYNRSDGCHIRFITPDGAQTPVLLKNGATETEIVVPWKQFEELWNGSGHETIGGLNVTPTNKLKRANQSRASGIVREKVETYSRTGTTPGRSIGQTYTEVTERRGQSLGRGARGTVADRLRYVIEEPVQEGTELAAKKQDALVTLNTIEQLPAPIRRVYETGNMLVILSGEDIPPAISQGTYLIVPQGGISDPLTLTHEALHWALDRGNVSPEMLGRMDTILSSISADVWRIVRRDHKFITKPKFQVAAEYVVARARGDMPAWDAAATGSDSLYNFIMDYAPPNLHHDLVRGKLPIKINAGAHDAYYHRIVNLAALYGAMGELAQTNPLTVSLGPRLQAEMYSYLVESTPTLALEIFNPFNFPEARLLDLANRYGFAPDIAAAKATFDQLIAEGADPIMAREGATTALAGRLVESTKNLGIEKGMSDLIVRQVPADFRRVLSADEMVRDIGAHVLPQDFATLHAEKFAADVPVGDPLQSIEYIRESLESVGSLGGANPVRSSIYANAIARQLGIITEEEQMVFSITDAVKMVMGSTNAADEFLVSEPAIYYQVMAAAGAAWRGNSLDPATKTVLAIISQGKTPPPGSITDDVLQAIRASAMDGVSDKYNGKLLSGPNAQLLAELGADPQRIQSALRVYKDLNPDALVDDLNPFGTMIPRSIQDASQLKPRLVDDYAKIKDDVERAKFVHEVELDLARSKQELWNAFMETKFGPMKLSIREILGDGIAPEGEVLTKTLENLRLKIVADAEAGVDVSPLQIVYNHIMQFEHYVDSYANGLGVTRPFAAADRVGAILPPSILARDLFARYANDLTEFSKTETFLKTLDEFEAAMTQQVQTGMVRGANLPADQIDILKKMTEPMAREKESLLDLVLHGSKGAAVPSLGNKAWEGAVPKTARAMIDYENYNVLEASVKSVAPFSLFTIRSVPYWLETIAQHPEIARVYTKYLMLTDRVNRQNYITNTEGQPLKSMRGYIKMPGTDIYVNPFAALSFRYVLAAAQEIAVPDEEFYVDQKNVPQQIAGHFYEVGRALGMDLPPWISAPAMAVGILDRKSVTPYALAPFLELVPWWGLTYEIAGFRKIYDAGLSTYVNPAVSWQDTYIEQEALKIVMEKVENAPNDAAAWDAINEYKLAMGYREIDEYPYYRVAPREESQLWLDARKNVEKKDWFFTVGGYFTGMYGKSFTDADADLRVVRNNINVMKAAINNQVGRDLLKMDPDPIIARKQYLDAAYNTFDGNINLLYNLGRFMKIPETGGQAQGDERRKLMVKKLSEDTLRNDYLDGKAAIRDEREELLSSLPVGSDWSLKQPIYDEAAAKDAALENNPMYAPYVGYKGYSTFNKSPEEIELFYVNKIMYYIQGTQPDWDQAEMDYPTYMREVYNPWLATIPKIVQSYVNTAVIQSGRHGDPSGKWPSTVPISGTEELLDLDAYMMEWSAAFLPESYDLWRKSEHDIGEAFNESWKINIWNPYWEGMSLQEHSSDKELYHRDYMSNLPKQEAIIDWILADPIYGTRFTRDELEAYLKGAGGMVNPEQRLEQSRNETEDKSQDIWDVILALGPGSGGRDALEVEIARLGGDPSDLNTFYDTSGTWGSVSSRTGGANFNKFHDILMQAANNLGLEPPTEEVLREFSAAQEDNDMFRASMEKTYGAEIWTDLAVYSQLGTAEKKQMRAEKPYLAQYWDDKDTFAANHQTWAKYYNPTQYTGAGGTGGGSGGSYGGGGGRGGRGYTTMQVPMKKMVPIPYESGLSTSATPMGRRGDMKVLGSAGNVPWPAGFSKLIGPVAMQEITQMYTVRVPLSAKTQEFLTATAQRNPQYTDTVTTILNTNLGLTERQFEGNENIAGGIPR